MIFNEVLTAFKSQGFINNLKNYALKVSIWKLQLTTPRTGKDNELQEGAYLLASDANIGEATRRPTINADDRTPSWKLFKLKSPLQAMVKK